MSHLIDRNWYAASIQVLRPKLLPSCIFLSLPTPHSLSQSNLRHGARLDHVPPPFTPLQVVQRAGPRLFSATLLSELLQLGNVQRTDVRRLEAVHLHHGDPLLFRGVGQGGEWLLYVAVENSDLFGWSARGCRFFPSEGNNQWPSRVV
jgi:hypothetical protein